MPVVPMLTVATVALIVAYVLVPAPQRLGKRKLAILAGQTPQPTLLDRLMSLPGEVKRQFMGLGREAEVGNILLLKLVSAGLGALAGIVAGTIFLPQVPSLVPMAIMAGAAYFAPSQLHKRRREARRDQVERELVFFLASLRAFCKLGSLYQALELSLGNEEGLLAQAVRQALGKMALGKDPFESLHEAALVLDTPAFTTLVDTLQQSQAVGAPLETAVAAVEDALYEKWEMEAQAQIGTMDFRLTVLGVIVLIPAIILVSVVPAVIQVVRIFR